MKMILTAVLLGLLPTVALAQESDRTFVLNERNANRAESYQLDITVPESPALALVGADSANVATPQDASSLGLDLANIADDGGGIRPGIAITVAPYWLGVRNMTLGEYRDPRRNWERALRARTRLSLATVAMGGDNADGRRAAVGITFQPLDSTDPRMDTELDRCVIDAGDTPQKRLNALAGEMVRSQHPDYTAGQTAVAVVAQIAALQAAGENGDGGAAVRQFSAALNTCIEAWRERRSHASNLLISLGYTMHSDSGSFDNLDGDGVTAWAGYSWSPRLRLGDDISTRVNLYGRYSQNTTLAVNDTTAEADESVAAVSVSMIAPQRWELGVEGAYFHQDFSNHAIHDREFSQVSVNASYRLNDSIWLRAAYGTRDNDEDDEFVRLSVVVRQRGRT